LYLVEGAFAEEELPDLRERHTDIAPDRKRAPPSLLDPARARDAEEMPDAVLDVVRVDRLVALELLSAVLVAARPVERDPPSPVVRRELGTVGEVSIEGGDRLFGASALEEGVAVAVVRVRVLRVELDDSRPVGGCLLVTAEARADLRAQAMSSDALR